MKHRTSKTLFTYWNEIRRGRMAPHRFEVEPSRITAILCQTFILERIEEAGFRYRIAGTRICEIFGDEFRGRSFLDGWGASDSEILRARLIKLATLGAVIQLELEGSTNSGKRLTFECVMLPLVQTGNAITRVLGAISAQTSPPWIGYEPITSRALLGIETIWPDGRPFAVTARPQQLPVLDQTLAGARRVTAAGRRFRILDGGLAEVEPKDP